MERHESIAFEGIDSDTPLNEKLCAKYTRSFAYHTVKDRLPVILMRVINHLLFKKRKIVQELNKEMSEKDLKSVIGQISKLRNELVTNKAFINLNSKGNDVKDWNNYLELQLVEELDPPCWYYSPWLYSECYMYRRLQEVFENSQTLQSLDPFEKVKEDAFYWALPVMKTIAKDNLYKFEKNLFSQNLQNSFVNFLKLSLWSNQCDFSLKVGEELSKDNFYITNINVMDSFLLQDDSLKVYDHINQNSNQIIDFVTDNTAFEIFCDFCFCDLLCSTSLASKIRFHVKQIPWYVSDVTRKDINWLLEKLAEEDLGNLVERWKGYLESGVWCIYDEKYWTLPNTFTDMKAVDSKLYYFLSESNLIIFKGDLNSRKLLGDINWNPNEKFDVVLRDFKPTSILSLRTVKSDIICGIPPEKNEHLENNKEWMHTGNYAVIQFYKKQ